MPFWRSKPPLSGAPAVRRLKTYPAASGYVYQYFYNGMRREAAATEYVFEVHSAGRPVSLATVRMENGTLSRWASSQGRDVRPHEEYAFAKMALFEAFDAAGAPAQLAGPICPDAATLSRIAGALNW